MSTLPPGYPREPDDLIDNSPEEEDPDYALERERDDRNEALLEDKLRGEQEDREMERRAGIDSDSGKPYDIGAANARQNEYYQRVGGRSPLRPPAEEDGND